MARLRQWSDRKATQDGAFQNAIPIAQAGRGGEGVAWAFGVSRRERAGLVAVEDDRAYMLRLFFRDQPQAEVFRMVSGATEMRARIEAHLPKDAAAPCPSSPKSRRSAAA